MFVDDSFKLDDNYVFLGTNSTHKTRIMFNKRSVHVYKTTLCSSFTASSLLVTETSNCGRYPECICALNFVKTLMWLHRYVNLHEICRFQNGEDLEIIIWAIRLRRPHVNITKNTTLQMKLLGHSPPLLPTTLRKKGGFQG
jgi:hypothetical protein